MSPSSPAGSSSSSLSEDYTNVLLALPDGVIPTSHPDIKSYTISSIGGYPTFPSTSNIPKEINCGICHKSIPLLTQVYCPLENGENDRTIYVFACSKLGCQKRDGSVRAFRASIRNEEYARDVEEKRKIAEAEAAAEREKARKNPFTLSSDSQPNGSSLFGSAQPLFGAAPSSNPFSTPTPASEPSDTTPDISKLSISSSSPITLFPPIPAYQPAQYITTIDEYIPPPEDLEYESSDSEGEDVDQELKATMLDDNLEKLLSPKHIDEVFSNFIKRLESSEGVGSKQILRYEFNGIPLPYSSSSPITKKLFPGCEKPLKSNEELNIPSLYNPSGVIPQCTRCKSQRVFELQLTPYLISLLKPTTLSTTGVAPNKEEKTKQTEEERKKELNELANKLKSNNDNSANEDSEMEWGTIHVFGCENDCIGFNEEFVGVEWEMSMV